MKLIHACAIAVALVAAAPTLAGSFDRDAWMAPEVRAQLRQGMTRDQVVQLLGKPTRLRQSRSGAGLGHDYEYRSADDQSWMMVTYLGDVFFSYSVARLANPGGGSGDQCGNLTKWAQIRPGIPLERVEQVLGKPSATSHVGGFMPDESLSGWLYDVTSHTDGATGIVALDPTGGVIGVTEPLCPPVD